MYLALGVQKNLFPQGVRWSLEMTASDWLVLVGLVPVFVMIWHFFFLLQPHSDNIMKSR